MAAAVSLALPIVAGDLADRLEWGVIAACGGFLSVYGAERKWRERRRVLPRAAIVMLLCAGIGVATSEAAWVSLVGMWVATVLSAWLSPRLRIGFPGSLMPVLAAGMAGRAAAPAERGGLGESPVTVLVLVAAGLVVAYLAASLPVPHSGATAWVPEPPRWSWFPPRGSADRVLIFRLWAAGTAALAVLSLWPQGQPYWVFLTVSAVLQASHRRRVTLVRGCNRVLGTIVGLGLFLAFDSLELSGVLLGILIGLLQACVELLAARHYAIGLVFVTPAALLLVGALPRTADESFAAWRLADTVVGALIACAVVLAETALDRERQSAGAREVAPHSDLEEPPRRDP